MPNRPRAEAGEKGHQGITPYPRARAQRAKLSSWHLQRASASLSAIWARNRHLQSIWRQERQLRKRLAMAATGAGAAPGEPGYHLVAPLCALYLAYRGYGVHTTHTPPTPSLQVVRGPPGPAPGPALVLTLSGAGHEMPGQGCQQPPQQPGHPCCPHRRRQRGRCRTQGSAMLSCSLVGTAPPASHASCVVVLLRCQEQAFLLLPRVPGGALAEGGGAKPRPD